MSTTTRKATPLRGGRRLRDGHVLYWWVEVLAIIAFYLIYSAVRNANEGGTLHAFHNAQHIISIEHHLGLYHEETMQRWALHFKPIIIMANYFYGSLHFVVTIFTGIWLYRRFSDDYPRFRNALAISTAIALVGFVTFPLMPPRLLHGHIPDYGFINYGFVDTLAKYPTIWSFNSGAASRISNQYAAMPSVHIAWATWCAFALVPRLRSRVGRILAFCYPFFTVIVIVITANHYILDAVAGAATFLVGWFMSGQITRAGRGRTVPVA